MGVGIANPSAMDSYVDAMLGNAIGSRYASRIWTDKSVLAYDAAGEEGGLPENALPLDVDTDGCDGSVYFDADFLNVYSALGSS